MVPSVDYDHDDMIRMKKRIRRLEINCSIVIMMILCWIIHYEITVGSIHKIEETILSSKSVMDEKTIIHNALKEISNKIFLLSEEMESSIKKSKKEKQSLQEKVFEKKNKSENNEIGITKHNYPFDEKKIHSIKMKKRARNRLKNSWNKSDAFFSMSKDNVEHHQIMETSKRRNLDSEHYFCHDYPFLDAFHDTNTDVDGIFKSRNARILDKLYTISSYDKIHDFDSPQYKAACYILFDDIHKLDVYDEHMVESYALYVFLFSTKFYSFDDSFRPMKCNIYDGLALVYCGPDKHILRLLFHDLGLTGTLPSEIQHLRYLTRFDVSNNQLHGTIPTEMGQLTHLNDFFIASNHFTGTIPTEIAKIPNLDLLIFTENHLEGSIPSELYDITELTLIDFASNKLTGTMSSAIGQLHRLVWFALDENYFTGTIPTEIGNLTDADVILLDSNMFEGQLPMEMSNCVDLEALGIFDNKFNGTLPDIYGNLPKLNYLFADHNEFTGEIPSSLWNVSFFSLLSISNNHLHGTVPDDFCYVDEIFVDHTNWFTDTPKVECKCCIQSCRLWDPTDVIIASRFDVECPEGNIMNLEEDYGITPIFVLDIHAKERIEERSITSGICRSPTACYRIIDIFDNEYFFGYSHSNNSIIESDPANPICDALEVCGTIIDSNHPKRNIVNYFMQILEPDNSIFYDTNSYKYKALCQIIEKEGVNELDICDGTMLQFFIMSLFFSSTNIEWLSDDVCNTTGIKCGKSGKFITDLNFHDTNLTGSVISELGLLQSLQAIDLSGNKLYGTINNSMMEKLPHLEVFNVADNSLEGEIPMALLLHSSIKDLYLSNNFFVGTLPNIKYPYSLETFHVSNNLLDGSIPDSIFQCHNLHTINLSKNKLDGTIPSLFGPNFEFIYLHENEIKGSVPNALFHLQQIKVLMLQSNKLTGSIPTYVGKLQHVTKLLLNHNQLKGHIPLELQEIQNVTILHLHHNELEGNAPILQIQSYITDCGRPNFLSMECPSCTMCCNSDDRCQNMKPQMIWKYILFGVGIVCGLALLYYIGKPKEMDVSEIYDRTSIHSFLFVEEIKIPRILYIVCICIQVLLFISYFVAFHQEKYIYQCKSIECIKPQTLKLFGWICIFVFAICFIGPDAVMSLKQIQYGWINKDGRWMLSGFVLLGLVIIAITFLFMHNWALAEDDFDIIFSAIILLLIMQLDNHIFFICQRLSPSWTQTIAESIQLKMGN